jgi:hypothetical protein
MQENIAIQTISSPPPFIVTEPFEGHRWSIAERAQARRQFKLGGHIRRIARISPFPAKVML